MKKIITFFLLIILLPVAVFSAEEKENVFKVTIHYDRGQAAIFDLEVGSGFVPGMLEINKDAPLFRLESVAENGEILDRREFNIHLEQMGEPPPPGEESENDMREIILEEVFQLVIIPYFSNIKWLNLYDANYNLIEKKDVSIYSQICGNGICQNNENSENCPSDCLRNAEELAGNSDLDSAAINDKKQELEDLNKVESEKAKIVALTLLFSLLALLIAASYYLIIKKKE